MEAGRTRAVVNLVRFLTRPDVGRDPLRLLKRRLWYEFLHSYAARRLDTDRLVRFDRNLLMSVRLTDPIERSLYLYGFHEFRVVSVFLGILRPGMKVLDAGAHDGQYTLLAAKRVGIDGQVIAVEPNPSSRARLFRNIALNHFTNVHVISSALSDSAGEAPLFVPTASELRGQASLRAGWGNLPLATSINVVTERLDSLLARLGWQHLDLVKIDVEGFESQVISGGRQAIAVHRPAIIFEANDLTSWDGKTSAPAIDMLRDFGYRIHGVSMNRRGHWWLQEVAPNEDPRQYREPWAALNLVALHPMSPRPAVTVH